MNLPNAMDTPAPAALILGTTNEGKVRELVELLAPFGIPCRSLRGLAVQRLSQAVEHARPLAELGIHLGQVEMGRDQAPAVARHTLQ